MRARWITAALVLLVLDAYLLLFRWTDVAGNIEAQFVIVTPAFIAHHVLTRRHLERLHAETRDRLDAQDDALATAHKQVGELHALHLHGEWPEDRHRAR